MRGTGKEGVVDGAVALVGIESDRGASEKWERMYGKTMLAWICMAAVRGRSVAGRTSLRGHRDQTSRVTLR